MPSCTAIPETIGRFNSIQEVNYAPLTETVQAAAAAPARISFHQLPTQCGNDQFHSLGVGNGGGGGAFERGKAHSSARFASSACCRADGKLVDIDGLSSQQLRQSCGHFHRPASWLPFDRESGYRATLGGAGGAAGGSSGPHSILVTTTRGNGPSFLRSNLNGAGGRGKPRPKSMDATVLQSLESKIVISAGLDRQSSKQSLRRGGGGPGSCDTEEDSSDSDGSAATTDTNENKNEPATVTVQHRTTHVHVNPSYQQQQRNISQV